MVLQATGKALQPLIGAVSPLFSGRGRLHRPILPQEDRKPIPETSRADLDAALALLSAHAPKWAGLAPELRARVIERCIASTLAVVEDAASESARVKGSHEGGPGEEIVSWAPILSGLRQYVTTLKAGGQPKPTSVIERADGRHVVEVLPTGLESLLLGGAKGELWIKPGEQPTQGSTYRGGASSGGVGLVLGAGNQISVAALDVLHKLVADSEVVICKMNPVNEYLGPHLQLAFKPLVDEGYLRVVYGGGRTGAYLVNHETIKSVHLTGSEATYNAIVWGGTPRKGEEPSLKKPVGAELGCVTPYIVVPGKMSAKDLARVAESVAGGLTHNCGHNCLKAELVLLDAEWPQREEFLNALRGVLSAVSRRWAYYPGSESKFKAFEDKFTGVEQLGKVGEVGSSTREPSPWLLKAGLKPGEADTTTENWAGVLQQIDIPGSGGDPAKFLEKAVEFANDKAWGTLSCALFVDPTTQKELRGAFDGAIASLRYGSITVNAPGIVAFAQTKLGWGGYPGTTPEAIGSGNCMVHNTLLFDHVEKSVLYMPFHFRPKPFWSPLHTNSTPFGIAFVRFCAYPNLWNLTRVVPAALIG